MRQRGRHDERVEADHERRPRRRATRTQRLHCASAISGRCRCTTRHRPGENRTVPFPPERGVLTRSDVDRRSANGQATSAPSRRWSSRTGASSRCTATACSARCRTPRTSSRRRCWPPGAGSAASSSAPRCAPGCTGSRRTAASTPCASAGAGPRSRTTLTAPPPTRYVEPSWLQPYPDERAARPGARPRGALRAARGDPARVRRRAPAAARAPARRARAARRARLPHRGGRGDARRHATVGQGRAAARAGDARRARARARARAAARLARRARRSSPASADAFEARRHRARRRAAHRRGAADDAAAAARVPPATRRSPRSSTTAPTVRGAPLELRPTRANGQPAFGCYLHSRAWGIIALTLSGEQIAEITAFSDPSLVAGSACRARSDAGLAARHRGEPPQSSQCTTPK